MKNLTPASTGTRFVPSAEETAVAAGAATYLEST